MKILDIPRSGSYAGVTSSHNRAGQYVRNRRTPTNSPSARRTFIRTAMRAASSGFSALTPSVQAAWASFADAHPRTDALGSSIKLTGHQQYVACAVALANAGGAAPSAPPVSASVFSASGSTGVMSVASGLVLTLSGLGAAGDYLLIALSRPLPGARLFWKTFRQQAVVAGNAVTYTLTTADYAALFGAPVAGQKVFVKLTPVNQYGVTGTALVLAIVVT
jgi:hypothetical protein